MRRDPTLKVANSETKCDMIAETETWLKTEFSLQGPKAHVTCCLAPVATRDRPWGGGRWPPSQRGPWEHSTSLEEPVSARTPVRTASVKSSSKAKF